MSEYMYWCMGMWMYTCCCVPTRVEVCGCVQEWCMCLGDVYALGAHRLSLL